MGRAASTGVRGRTARAAGGPEWCRVRETMGGVYPGPGAGIVSRGGSAADSLLGRLRWGGAAWPRRSPRARLRRGPGRRRGRWVAKAGLTSGFAAVATTAPPLWRKLPPTLGPRVRPEETAETEAHEGSGRVGPVASGSGRAAAAHPPPCQRDSARPGQHGPRRTPPRERASGRRLSRRRGCLCRRLSRSWLASAQPPSTAARSSVGSSPRAPDPAHAAPPRATPQLQTSRRAPLPPTPPTAYPSRPLARDATRESSVRLRGHTHSVDSRQPRPSVFFRCERRSWERCLRLSLYWSVMSQGWGRKLWVCDRSSRFPANTETDVPEGWVRW